MVILRIVLFPLSILYGVIVWFRNKLFDWGILKSHTFQLPVISIGNLSVGGTGKTPHIEYLIRLLSDDFRVATLSRGYGRKTKGYLLAAKHATAKDIGDEPRQFLTKFDNIDVAVCEKRVNGINLLLNKEPKPQLILLDDAFQHRYVKPGLNILLTNFSKIFNHNFVVPTGSLREFPSGSKRADVVVVSKSPKILSPIERRRVENEIKLYPHQKLYFSYIKYGKLTQLPFSKVEADLCKTTVIILFTGIANTQTIEEYLKLKCTELIIFRFSDHHAYTTKDLEKVRTRYLNTFQKQKIVVTTEKDFMRLDNPELQNIFADIPAFYLPIEIKFHPNEKGPAFDDLIKIYVEKNANNH